MGYKRPVKTYELIFEDDEFEGLVVETKSVPLGQFLSIMELAETADDAQKNPAKALQAVQDLFVAFSKSLVSWNLEDEDGTPIPADLEGVKSQEMEFMLAVVRAWVSTIAGVSAPLGDDSTNGGTSQVAMTIPQETL